jgi:hypothetical protein
MHCSFSVAETSPVHFSHPLVKVAINTVANVSSVFMVFPLCLAALFGAPFPLPSQEYPSHGHHKRPSGCQRPSYAGSE